MDTLTCEDLQSLFGSDAVSQDEFAHSTGLTKTESKRIFEAADSALAGKSTIDLATLCTYLDGDEDWTISTADFSQNVFGGSMTKAKKFMKLTSRLIHPENTQGRTPISFCWVFKVFQVLIPAMPKLRSTIFLTGFHT